MDGCVYCGAAEELTADHVPPKCLFDRPLPTNLVTVPACAKCNQRLGTDDEYFKTAMLFRWDTTCHPAADARRESAMRAVSRPGAGGFRRLFTDTIQSAPIVLSSGLYVEPGGRFEVDGERILGVVARIARGLHYAKVGKPLPSEQDVHVLVDEELQQSDPATRMDLLRSWAPITKGEPEWIGKDETFGFFWQSPGLHSSAWLMIFYSKIIFYAATSPTVPSDHGKAPIGDLRSS